MTRRFPAEAELQFRKSGAAICVFAHLTASRPVNSKANFAVAAFANRPNDIVVLHDLSARITTAAGD